MAVIKTTKGELVLELWPDVAPQTVENFKKLADSKFYDGTTFNSVIKGFSIAGGDPQTKDPSRRESGGGRPGHTVKDEFSDRKHVRGVISMVRTAQPNSASSEFFICLAAIPRFDGKYTAFGKLTKGEEVLTKIEDTATKMNLAGTAKDVPVEPIFIESIRIQNNGSRK